MRNFDPNAMAGTVITIKGKYKLRNPRNVGAKTGGEGGAKMESRGAFFTGKYRNLFKEYGYDLCRDQMVFPCSGEFFGGL